MDISHCFEQGSVVCDLASSEKYQALRELICKAAVFSTVDNLDHFAAAVLSRERIQSTGLGRGVALAHGKAKGVKRTVIALGISKSGINFNSVDTQPVQLLFIIAVAPNNQTEYLAVLSTLVRLMRNSRFRTSVLEAPEAKRAESIMHEAFYQCLSASCSQTSGSQTSGLSASDSSASDSSASRLHGAQTMA